MNKLFKISLVFILFLSIYSCSKDDEVSTVNTVQKEGQPFTINAAAMTGVSIDDEGHTAITFVNGTGSQANTLTIDVESFTKETIPGTYSYPLRENDKRLDDWLTNYMVFEEDGSNSSNLKSGTVTISHNGDNNYTVEMDLIMNDGLEFSGQYTGEFSVMFMNH